MKVLAKIARRKNTNELPNRRELVEMDLFDTDRNPLEFPTASGSSSSGATSNHTPGGPWTGTGTKEVVVPWGALGGDSSIADLTTDNHIRLLEVGQYLVNFEASFEVNVSAETLLDAGAFIGVYTPSGSGPQLTRLSGQSNIADVESQPRAFSVIAPVIVTDAPLEIITVVYADVYPQTGTTSIVHGSGRYDWPLAPYRLQVIKF